MMLRSRLGGLLMGLSLVGGLGLLPTLAQDPAKVDPAAPKQFRRVPPYFSKAGVTPEQKEKIYGIRARHQEKIESLQRQIDEAKAQELAECEAVLLESQKKVLAQLRADGQAKAKARSKAARAEADAKSETKAEAKTGN